MEEGHGGGQYVGYGLFEGALAGSVQHFSCDDIEYIAMDW